MDWLLEIAPALEKEVFHQVATLLNLEVDLLFFDTTSTYFCRDEADEPVSRDGRGHRLPPCTGDGDGENEGAPRAGFRTHGKGKDRRDDLPQVVVGMAVTREGIPVRVWSRPGNTADSALVREVKDDLRDWTLSRIVWVADRGFSSAENRRYLRRGDHHYIIGEKLRSGSAAAKAALSRAGRYQEVASNLRVKEVKIAEGERFVICYNPEAAALKRAELRGVISTKPGLQRYLRTTAGGLLRIDAQAIAAEEKLDGKYLLRSKWREIEARASLTMPQSASKTEYSTVLAKTVQRTGDPNHRPAPRPAPTQGAQPARTRPIRPRHPAERASAQVACSPHLVPPRSPP